MSRDRWQGPAGDEPAGPVRTSGTYKPILMCFWRSWVFLRVTPDLSKSEFQSLTHPPGGYGDRTVAGGPNPRTSREALYMVAGVASRRPSWQAAVVGLAGRSRRVSQAPSPVAGAGPSGPRRPGRGRRARRLGAPTWREPQSGRVAVRPPDFVGAPAPGGVAGGAPSNRGESLRVGPGAASCGPSVSGSARSTRSCSQRVLPDHRVRCGPPPAARPVSSAQHPVEDRSPASCRQFPT
jgi:hypothetical protein